MNSHLSQNHSQPHPVPGDEPLHQQRPSGEPEGLNQAVPEDGADDIARNRGDTNPAPQQDRSSRGRLPLRHQGEHLDAYLRQGWHYEEGEDEEGVGDKRPNSETDGEQIATPTGRS